MLQFDFMRHAFLAGTFVGIMGGMVGVFVIARRLSFITHAFSHIGFSGAAFAVFVGWPPLNGLLIFAIASALALGQMGVKVFRRESAINVLLSLFLGLGFLFISLSSKHTSYLSNLLFGSIVSISLNQVLELCMLSVLILLLLAAGYRLLVFDSFDPEGAQAAGLPTRLVSILFLLLLSVAVASAVQIIGALLVFTLMTIPASTAKNLTSSIVRMIGLSVLLAVLGVWIGIMLAYVTNWPTSFFISAVEGVFYGVSLLIQRQKMTVSTSQTKGIQA